ncbi:MAG: peptidylprolyl isomerase [Actinomycetota bacterium]
MKLRPVLLLVGFSLLIAACGVSRDADLTGAASPSVTVEEESADADGENADDTSATTAVPTTTSPATATTAPADEVAATVAFDNGVMVEILHGELNDVFLPTQENREFVDLAYRGQVPDGFNAIVLSQDILGRALDNELVTVGAEVSDEDRAEAGDGLTLELSSLLNPATAESDAERLFEEVPYLRFIAELQAKQIALSDHLSENAEEGEGSPCVRHILLGFEDVQAQPSEEEDAAQEAAADDVVARLEGGADFGEMAVEFSTGPTGPSGGELGCAPSANYVPEFAEAVDSAEVGEFVGPVRTQFGWHVIVVDGYEVDGDTLAQQRMTSSLEAADIVVDERVGAWDPVSLIVAAAP